VFPEDANVKPPKGHHGLLEALIIFRQSQAILAKVEVKLINLK
jgi:hypothetical protein